MVQANPPVKPTLFTESLSSCHYETERSRTQGSRSHLYDILTSVGWIITSMGLFYFLDLGMVLFYDNTLNRTWLWASVVFGFITGALALFNVIWLTYFKKIHPDEWNIRYPSLIPIATTCAILGFLSFNVAFWPKYSFLTPLVGFIFVMGFVSAISFLPEDNSNKIPKSIHAE